MDLLLELPSGRRTRATIEAALRTAITTGAVPPGAALPSTRELAAELSVARGTVVAAIEQLAVQGLVETRPGAATRVTAVPGPAPSPPAPPHDPAPPPVADFSGGEPDLTAFPAPWWSAAARRVLSSGPAGLLAYGDPRGQPVLREALAVYLRRTRGVAADPDRVVVTAGFSHGLAVLARVIREHHGGVIAIEDPSLWVHRRILSAAGLSLRPAPVDGQGVDVDALPSVDGAAALVTPAHQTPLGVTMSPPRRRAVAEWAASHDGLVIEDDYDGELRYDRRPVPALQARDPSRIVYGGSASKALAPGLRLGWLVLPHRLVAPVTSTVGALGGSPVSTLDQAVLAEVLSSGRYDRHVRAIRSAYRRRRDELVAVLARRAPAVRVDGVAAGLAALLRLPGDADERAVAAALAEQSVAVMPLGDFRVEPSTGVPGVVVNFGRPFAHAYRDALERLASGLAEALAS